MASLPQNQEQENENKNAHQPALPGKVSESLATIIDESSSPSIIDTSLPLIRSLVYQLLFWREKSKHDSPPRFLEYHPLPLPSPLTSVLPCPTGQPTGPELAEGVGPGSVKAKRTQVLSKSSSGLLNRFHEVRSPYGLEATQNEGFAFHDAEAQEHKRPEEPRGKLRHDVPRNGLTYLGRNVSIQRNVADKSPGLAVHVMTAFASSNGPDLSPAMKVYGAGWSRDLDGIGKQIMQSSPVRNIWERRKPESREVVLRQETRRVDVGRRQKVVHKVGRVIEPEFVVGELGQAGRYGELRGDIAEVDGSCWRWNEQEPKQCKRYANELRHDAASAGRGCHPGGHQCITGTGPVMGQKVRVNSEQDHQNPTGQSTGHSA